MRQQFRLRLDRLGKALGHHLRNTLVILLASAPQQRLIRGVLDQGMLEEVCRLRRHPPLVQELCLHQLV
jgi:hypothetical protein